MSHLVITIDGPAASGKGTLSRAVAAHFGLPQLDVGILYRTVGLMILRDGCDLEDHSAILTTLRRLKEKLRDVDAIHRLANDPDLRLQETGKAASVIASYPKTNASMASIVRLLARNLSPYSDDLRGCVADGRCGGTYFFPKAAIKFFITADIGVRAYRRWVQLSRIGVAAREADVMEEIRARDEIDTNRPFASLAIPDDAFVIETTMLSIDDVVEIAVGVASKKIESLGLKVFPCRPLSPLTVQPPASKAPLPVG